MNPPIPTIPQSSHSQGGLERQAVDIKQVKYVMKKIHRMGDATLDKKGLYSGYTGLTFEGWEAARTGEQSALSRNQVQRP